MPHYDTVIVGAGIAGCSVAYFLHKSGRRVLVLDKNGIAGGGSGAAGAFVSPKIGVDLPLKNLSDEAFAFAILFYRQHFPEYFHQTGIVRIPKNDKNNAMVDKFEISQKHNILSIKELQEANINSNFNGIEFVEAGLCDSKEICTAMLDGIEIRLLDVGQIIHDGEFWHIDENIISKNIILATGYENNIVDIRYMSISGIWGNRADFDSELNINISLHEKISISANINGVVKIGATHELDVACLQPCSHKSVNMLLENAGELVDTSDFVLRDMFCGMRASNRDYTPVVGAVVDTAKMLEYPNILNGRKYPLVYHENLYVLNALGARGFVFAPYLANELANHIVSGIDIDNRVNPDRLFYNWIRKI